MRIVSVPPGVGVVASAKQQLDQPAEVVLNDLFLAAAQHQRQEAVGRLELRLSQDCATSNASSDEAIKLAMALPLENAVAGVFDGRSHASFSSA